MLPYDNPDKDSMLFAAKDGRDVDGVPLIRSRFTTILDLPPSCIDFSPTHPQCWVVGTYFLEPDPETSHTQVQDVENSTRPVQNRRGSLILLNTEGNAL